MHPSSPPGPSEPVRGSRTLPAEEEASPTRLGLRLTDGREIPLDRPTVIGSGPGSDVVLRDPFVSGRHCVVLRDGGRTVLRDCSRNGTWLGGLRMRHGEGELRPGLPLVLGRTPLRVVAAQREEAADGMIGQSEPMRRLRASIERVARTPWPVLLLGESGTGKELAARALHARSGRCGRFVAVNCGALSRELVESELFGHERGAFTGAVGRKVGVFEEADGGTLLLDEIGELPAGLQPKLLRALEAQCIRAVGATIERRIDVRVVAATHRDLGALERDGAFRLDLHERLAGCVLRLPPLRERADDIPQLARHFLAEIAVEHGPRELSPAALAALGTRRWPGNVRQLRNALRSAALQTDGLIEPEHLPPEPAPARDAASTADGAGVGAITAREPGSPVWDEGCAVRRMDEIEREAIAAALRRHGTGRKAAQALGMPKSTLYDKARRHGIRLHG